MSDAQTPEPAAHTGRRAGAPSGVRDGGVRVRRARAADTPRAAVLFNAYRQCYGQPPDLAAAGAFLAARLAGGESAVLLAYAPTDAPGAAGAPIGFAQRYPSFSSVALAPVVVLNDLFVAPHARRGGVGRHLIAAAAAYAGEAGELAPQRGNGPARRLYAALGFTDDTEFAHLSLALSRPVTAAAGK